MVERRGRVVEREELLGAFFSSLMRMNMLVLDSARGSMLRSFGLKTAALPFSSGSLSRLLDRRSDVGRSEDARLSSPCFGDDE